MMTITLAAFDAHGDVCLLMLVIKSTKYLWEMVHAEWYHLHGSTSVPTGSMYVMGAGTPTIARTSPLGAKNRHY